MPAGGKKMENVIKKLTEFGTDGAIRIVLAIIAWFIGKVIIKAILKAVDKIPAVGKLDPTVAKFTGNIIKTVLYIILAVCVIGILGVPMASIIAVLASAGIAVGMALQGALGNVAGGIMIMLFRPFNVGDFVSTAGAEGTVTEIGLFYTVITTPQNTKITIPNGSLMAANVVNYTANDTRRIDLSFTIGKDADLDLALRVILAAFEANDKVLKEPGATATVTGGSDTAAELAGRCWVAKEDYIAVREALIRTIAKGFGKYGITAPAVRIING
jgi:small conductance mechanosensitive channel